ncbi:MAG: hypothetical protein NT004_00955 [Bacteroidetes bacterium]|nr:hypothetical protein [Bacteroidota bacterium]
MVKTPGILVIMLLFFPGISKAQEREPIEQIKSLMESCQFSQAVSLAELLLLQDSSRIDLLLIKGRAQAAGFEYPEAIVTLRKALWYDSTNIKALNELVNVYRQSGDPNKAIATILKISSLVPDNRYFQLQLASLYYAENDFQKAVQILLPLYKTDSSSFFVAKQLGNCFNELKQSDPAIYFYRRALKIIPFDPYVTGKLVNIYLREDDVALALYFTQVFLAQDSVNIPILKQSGYCYYLLIDFKEAAKRLLTCARLGDSSKFTMKYLGLSYYKQEKYDTAAPFFLKAFSIDTTDAEVCFYYGVSAFRSLNIDTGLVYLNRTMRLLMPSGQFLSTLYMELAAANTSTGHSDTAIVLLTKALEANPGNNTIRFKIAYQYDYYLRELQKALSWYQEFLKNDREPKESTGTDPQQVSMSDYVKKRIPQITGKSPKKK